MGGFNLISLMGSMDLIIEIWYILFH